MRSEPDTGLHKSFDTPESVEIPETRSIAEIDRLYRELPDDRITLFSSYTTREQSFLDILLSKTLLSSREAALILGSAESHRGLLNGSEDTRHDLFDQNPTISFSTGFVSYKYSNPTIPSRKEYKGGYGILVPLDILLQSPELLFSHASPVGGICSRDLTRTNTPGHVHTARKQGNLSDDGYGNTFEILLAPTSTSRFPKINEYPRIDLNNPATVIAIPRNNRESLQTTLTKRQKHYAEFMEKLLANERFKRGEIVYLGRDVFSHPLETEKFLNQLLAPIDLDSLPIYWYGYDNLEQAMRNISIK